MTKTQKKIENLRRDWEDKNIPVREILLLREARKNYSNIKTNGNCHERKSIAN